MATSAPGRHVGWVDYARGLGILAVVVWHTAGGIVRAGVPTSSDVVSVIHAWDIYAYRSMPVFFLVSGLFVVGSLRRSNRQFLAGKAGTLLYPYVVWSLISLALGSVAPGAANNGVTLADAPRILYAPVLQYWFLPALFAVMVLFLLAYRLHIPSAAVLVAGVALYVAAAASGWSSAAGADEALYLPGEIGIFAVFFVVGAASGPQLLGWLAKAASPTLAGVALVGGAVTVVTVLAGPQPAPLGLPALAATACLAATVGAAVLLERSGVARFVGVWGRHSLEIYVAQVICAAGTRVVLQRLLHIEDFWLLLAVCSVAGIYLPLLLARMVERFHWPFVFTWPETVR